MNEFVRIAQLSNDATSGGDGGGGNPSDPLVLSRPSAQQSVVSLRQSEQLVDFRQILNEDISFIRIGDDLQMIFADGGMIIVQGFFDGDGASQVGIVFDGETISIDDFVTAANPQTADEIQTAAGETSNLATALGGPQGSGQNFEDTQIGALGDGLGFGDLLDGGGPGGDGGPENEFIDGEVDTVPEIGTPDVGDLDEADLFEGDTPLSFTGSLDLDFGDNAGTDLSLVFDLSNLPTDVTSDGSPLTFTITDNAEGDGGQTLTATKTGTTEVIFTVTLDIITLPNGNAGGNYIFELFGNLDHVAVGEDNVLPLTFGFIATDGDNFSPDSATSEFTVNITDDVLEIGDSEATSVDEEGLTDGNVDSGYDGDLPGAALTSTGDLAIDWGADDANPTDGGGLGDRSVAFDASQPGLTGLTSNGLAVTVAILSDGTLVGYTGTTVPTATSDAGIVFFATLSDASSGSYVFTVADNLDHPTADTEDDIILEFAYTATDGDGDTASSTFQVTVDDDAPVIGEPSLVDFEVVSKSVYESGEVNLSIPATGTSGTITSTIEIAEGGTIRDVNVSMDIQHTFMADLDITLIAPDGTRIGLIFDQGAGSNPNGVITFDDEAEQSFSEATEPFVGVWRPTADTLSGLDGLDQAGTWTLEIVDDEAGDTGILRSWSLDIEAQAPSQVNAIVDEDDLSSVTGDLADGNADDQPGDADTATDGTLDTDLDATTVFGDLAISWGADSGNSVENGGTSAGDGDRAITFSADAIATLEAAGLTSDGEDITYSLNGPENDLLTATAGDRIVFTVELFDTDSGSFKFDLQDALDHPEGFDENDLVLEFGFVATDSDGDTTSSSFTVGVDDDIAVVGDATLYDFDGSTVETFESGDVDLRIPATGTAGTITSTIEIANGGTIRDLNVSMDIQHTFMADLDITLIAPDGTRITLIIDEGGGGNPNGVITFDDEAAQSFSDATVPFVGVWRPTEDALSGLDGLDQAGTWTLEIVDAAAQDSGELRSWSLNIDADASTQVNAVVDEDDLAVGNNNDATGDDDPQTNTDLDSDSDATTVYGDLEISWGADDGNRDEDGGSSTGAGDRAVTFAADAIAALTSRGLTSHGEEITYSLNDTADLLTATAGDRTVFTVELFDTESGSFKFDLQDALDHPEGQDENGLVLTFKYNATDGDGDVTPSTFAVGVDDDVPVFDGSVATTQVDEEGLGGNPGESYPDNPGDFEGEETVSGSDLNISWGADDGDGDVVTDEQTGDLYVQDTPGGMGDRSVVFTTDSSGAPGVTATRGTTPLNGGLTSEGNEVKFVLNDGGTILLAYTGADATFAALNGAAASPDSAVVFRVSLTDEGTGAYSFELLGTLDHDLGGADSKEDNIRLEFDFTALDSDSDAISSTFRVIVDDDAPEFTGAIATTQVDEEGLVGGNPGESYPDNPGDFDGVPTDSGTSLNISWGADSADDDAVTDELTGNLYVQDTPGADGDRSVIFSTDGSGAPDVTATRGTTPLDGGLTSDGNDVKFVLNADGTILLAYTGADATFAALNGDAASPADAVVFRVSLTDEDAGAYSFELFDTLDHDLGGADSKEDNIRLEFGFTAQDGDGDIISSAFRVIVDDDAPEFTGAIATTQVDEEGLAGGNPGESYPDNPGDFDGVPTDSGTSLNISWGADSADDDAVTDERTGNLYVQDTPGADGDRSVIFSTDGSGAPDVTATRGTTQLDGGLTSDGNDVKFVLNADGTILLAYTGADATFAALNGDAASPADAVVFRVSLTDEDAGAYSFELFDTLDHDLGGADSKEDNIRLEFGFTAQDGDGDVISSTFRVIVDDDAPIETAAAVVGTVEEEGLTDGNEDTVDADGN
ncbi:proprotein convertase P-domain-containing protein, partial [uncultured Roseibium sp.]|uniref:T1SS-143 repeat domain-containing protein n=1 Tax=uncultured Roseibium sp. TaxID=1936171 RepID=UPI002637FBF9